MPGRGRQRLPLPADLSQVQRDFYRELQRLVDAAGLSCRELEKITSLQSPGGSKTQWGRVLNAQSQPERKLIKILTENVADVEICPGHLLSLWDRAFAPVPEAGQPAAVPRVPLWPPDGAGVTANHEQAARTPGSPASNAADDLAVFVTRECAAELNDRVLQGWEPLKVAWKPSRSEHADPEAAREVPVGHTASIGLLVHYVRCGHQLVAVGPDGAGKTTLATLLMTEMLDDRQHGDPVPVLIPAASLAQGEMVKGWLERTLADRYPSLRDTRVYGPGVISDLVTRHYILPVIESLDDLEPVARRQLLDALSRALGRSHPLIVTCRTDEFHEAVEACGHVMPGAAVIELQPVAAEDAARYLERGIAGPSARAWQPVITAIRSDAAGPLARALSSPLMVGLARAAYLSDGHMADALTGQRDQATIENQILESLISARFSARATSQDDRPKRQWNTQEADRWLAFLAAHLAKLRTYDLDWARLRYAMPAFTSPIRRAILGAGLALIVIGTIFGLSRGLLNGAGQGLLNGLAHGVDAALIVGAIYLLAPLSYPPGAVKATPLPWLRRFTRTALGIAIVVPAAYALESGLRDGIVTAWVNGVGAGVKHGLVAMALNWLVATALIWLATRANLFDLAERPVYFNMRMPGRGAEFGRSLTMGLVWGSGLGIVAGFGTYILSKVLANEHPLWYLGMPAGAVIGAAFALVQWGRAPVASAPVASPLSALRADRNLVLIVAIPFLIAMPAIFAAGYARGRHIQFHDFIQFGLYGLGIGLTIWLAIALSHAWPQYLITTAWLAARRKLPWHLAAFLNEAHDLHILRQRGSAYQFRHARLQDHLTQASLSRADSPGVLANRRSY